MDIIQNNFDDSQSSYSQIRNATVNEEEKNDVDNENKVDWIKFSFIVKK